ncbi:hypothetical protein GCM10010174_37770 [Kutzneria viridogrisea]|uniref:Outer membrane protein n=1 Tax=Kutzneria viridogrisea TaxID=47990 RepID=A0ABR6BU33_9PSEU|nr:putative outer membrane protein [Kutzneria viridogrisea]
MTARSLALAAAAAITLAVPATAVADTPPTETDALAQAKQVLLWQVQAGQSAQTKATAQAVKDAARSVVAEDTALCKKIDQLARQLGVSVPDQPSTDQQGWTAQLAAESGADFDRDFVTRSRRAGGELFTVVAAVRAGTKNDPVKQFALAAVDVVGKQLTAWDATTLVDTAALPDPPAPTSTAPVVPTPQGADPQVPQVTNAANSASANQTATDDRPGPAAVLAGLVLIVVLAAATVRIIRRVVNSA